MNSSIASKKPLYLDTSFLFSERAKDLVGRLTLDEKVGLMSQAFPPIQL